jgi:hypothetical protein
MVKWFKRIPIILVAAPLLALCIWYAVYFLPYLGEIKISALRGNKSIENIQHLIYPLAVAGETKEGIRIYAARQTYVSFAYKKQRRGITYWHFNNLLWYFLIPIHFTEQQIFGLWVDCALSECGGGFNKISHKYFGKELKDCSENELAALVALVRSPSQYAPNSQAGKQRTKEILNKSRSFKNQFIMNSPQDEK